MSGIFLIAFGAHPDDVELGAGGLCALHASDGVVVCDLTQAELSTNGDPITRRKEALASADILGVSERLCLSMPDRGIVIDKESIASIVRVIRTYKPTVIVAPMASDRHPDHGMCARLIYEAFFSSGLRRYDDGLAPHRPKAMYHYMINSIDKPSFVVDVTHVYDKKKAALAQYKSQFVKTHGVDTPITRGSFMPMIEGRDRYYGQQTGVAYAEGFWREEPVVVSSLAVTLAP